MQALTLLISMSAAILCAALRPAYAVCVYFVALLGYSQWVTVEIATLNFTTGRLVILGLVVNALRRCGGGFPFRWKAIDTWLVLGYATGEFALLHTTSAEVVIVREAGAFFDTLLAYFAFRALLKTRQDLIVVVKGWIVIGIVLALMGACQAATGFNPMGFMSSAYSFGLATENPRYQMRMGFYRANVTLGVSISFGLLFACLAPIALGLWNYRAMPKLLLIAAYCLLVLGGLSSMSSAPYMAIALGMAFLCGFPIRRYWPLIAAVILTGTMFVQTYSNRNFYEVLTMFSFDQSNGYYRTELIKECLTGGMRDHWLYGYGYVGIGPGSDNHDFHWVHQDLCNIYVGILASRGLFGLIPYLMANFLYFRMLYVAAKRARNVADQWLIWCISAALFSWNATMMTVSPMNQIVTMLYALMAVSANLPEIMAVNRTRLHPRLVLHLRRLLLQRIQARSAVVDV